MFGVGVVGRSMNSEWGRAVGPGSWMDWVGWGYCLDKTPLFWGFNFIC
jgi:hypothetical protein